jgi:cytochrome c peroxidase
MSRRLARVFFVMVGVVAIGACRAKPKAPADAPDASLPTSGAAAKSFYADRFSRKPTVTAMTELGRRLFFDPQLSASGQMSCATCHDPAFAYGPPNDRSTQLGGVDMKSVGLRAAPALRYLQTVPPFAEHHFDEGVDDSVDRGPTGGHTWDGRADTTHDQARLPLTSKFEMANADVDSVVARVAHGDLAGQFRAVFGDDVFSDSVRGSTALLLCLEVFQQSPTDFYPYRSRYDAYLRKQLELEPAELRGLELFNDPKKGNCASCHPSQITHDGFPSFTDFGFNALGVPRNRAIPANDDPAFYDLGLCGPIRTDLSRHKEYCGEFRVPSLRNITLRRSFFHNGVFHRLVQALEFYAERDTNPGKWYDRVDGRVAPFNDLPVAFQKNINHEGPFGGAPGGKPTLGKADIRDLIAFLETLTDGDLTKK